MQLLDLLGQPAQQGITCRGGHSIGRPVSSCALRLLSSLRRCNIGRPGRTLVLLLMRTARLRILRAKCTLMVYILV